MNNEMTGIALAVGLLWGGIAFAVLPDAIKTDDANQQAYNINHQYDNKDNQVDIDDEVIYQAIEGKAYKMVDGLASNEWVPLTADGYVDDYDQSAKAKEIKAANAKLRKIKGM